MKRILRGGFSIAGAFALGLAVASSARADDRAMVVGVAEPSSTIPNPYLLRSGVFTLGASYVPALVVAIESDRSADDHLYAPVVGPWLDLANRADCQGDCSGETVNKALLVTDGIFQGLGALQILGSFVFPETRVMTIAKADGTPAMSLSVMPAHIGRGKALVAVGTF